jgi:hypothetical protein
LHPERDGRLRCSASCRVGNETLMF